MATIVDSESVEAALLALAGVDADGARLRNDVGFNGTDSKFGRSLAQQILSGRSLSPKQRFFAYRIVRKYRVQLLRDHGIDYAKIPPITAMVSAPPKQETAPPTESAFARDSSATERLVQVRGRKILISYPYDADLVYAVKRIAGRWWNEQRKRWEVPLSEASARETLAFVDGRSFRIEGEDVLRAAAAAGDRNVSASRALDADLVIPGFGRPGFELRPFQRAGIAYVLSLPEPRAIIADPMGLGKTIQFLGVIKATNGFPALIEVPSIAWQGTGREAYRALPGHSIALLEGARRKRAYRMAEGGLDLEAISVEEALASDVVIIGYDVVSSWSLLLPKKRVNKDRREEYRVEQRGRKGWLLNDLPWRSWVSDETQNLKEAGAARTRATRTLVEETDPYVRLETTGTPIMNRAGELIVPLQLLDRLKILGGWRPYIVRYVETDEHLEELHERLRATCYVRREKSEVMPDLPPVQTEVVPIPLTNPERYKKIDDDLDVWIAERIEANAEFQQEIADQIETQTSGLADPSEVSEIAEAVRKEMTHRRMFAEQDKAYGPAAALVRINALKQAAAQEKLDSVIAWVREFLDSTTDPATGLGEKIVLFTWHREIGQRLAAAFGCDLIIGGDKRKRKVAEDRFQTDPEVRVIVLGIAAASVSITLTAATHTAFVEFPWRPTDIDQCEGRCYGRVNDPHGINSYYLAAAGTIDEDIAELLDSKRDVVTRVTSGVRADPERSILSELLRRIEERHGASEVIEIDEGVAEDAVIEDEESVGIERVFVAEGG